MNLTNSNSKNSLSSSKNFVLAGSLFWWFNLYLYVPILPIYSKESGASLQFVGMIIASYSIGQIFFRIPIGYLSDKMKSRKLFSVLAALFSCVGSGALYLSNQPIDIFLARTLTGIAAAGWVAISVYYSSFFSMNERSKSSTTILASNTFSVFAGTFCGGYLSDLYGLKICFLLSSLSGAIAMILFMISKEKKIATQTKFSSRTFLQLLKNPILIGFCAIGIFIQFNTFSTTFSFFPLYLNSLGFSDSFIGNITSFGTLFVLIGTISSPYFLKRIGFWKVATTFSVPLAIGTFLTLYISDPALLILVRLVVGFSTGVIFSSMMGLIVKIFDQNYQASAMGIFQSIYAIGMFSGPFISGIIGDIYDINAVFITSSIMGVAIFLIAYLMKSQKLINN